MLRHREIEGAGFLPPPLPHPQFWVKLRQHLWDGGLFERGENGISFFFAPEIGLILSHHVAAAK